MCKGAAALIASQGKHFIRKIHACVAHSDAQHTRIFTIVINSSYGALLLLKLLSTWRIRRKKRLMDEKFARILPQKSQSERLISLIWAILSAISDAATR